MNISFINLFQCPLSQCVPVDMDVVSLLMIDMWLLLVPTVCDSSTPGWTCLTHVYHPVSCTLKIISHEPQWSVNTFKLLYIDQMIPCILTTSFKIPTSIDLAHCESGSFRFEFVVCE